jgi:hypothetical protein
MAESDEVSMQKIERAAGNWSVDSLRELFLVLHNNLEKNQNEKLAAFAEHMEQRFVDNDKRYLERFEGQEKARVDSLAAIEKSTASDLRNTKENVAKQDAAYEKRFEAVNEFRNTLADQATRFIQRVEVENSIASVKDRIETGLKSLTDKYDTKYDAMNSTVTNLSSRLDRGEGRDAGVDKNKTDIRVWFLAAIAAISVIFVIIDKFGK